MLKFYREHIKIFIWLIILSFIAWGVGTLSISTGSSSSYAGSIRGKKISQKEFLMTLRFYELLSYDPSKKDHEPKTELLTEDQLRALTWQTIIVSRETKNQGIQISDEEIKAEVERLFSIDGNLDFQLYQNWVKQRFGSRPREFEEIIRRHLAVQKIRQKVSAGTSDAERDSEWVKWLTNTIGSAQLKEFTVKDQAAKF